MRSDAPGTYETNNASEAAVITASNIVVVIGAD